MREGGWGMRKGGWGCEGGRWGCGVKLTVVCTTEAMPVKKPAKLS